MSMKMRSFGKLGISGSAFGLGCMRFPMVEKDGKKVVDEENAIRIIRTAIDGGVTIRSAEHVLLYTSDKLSVENGEVRIANEGRFLPGETVTVDVPEGMFVDAYGNGNEHKSFAFSVTS